MFLPNKYTSAFLITSLSLSSFTAMAGDWDEGYFKIKASGGVAWLDGDEANLGVTEIETDTITFATSDVAGVAALGVGYAFILTDEDDDFRWFPAIVASLDGAYQFETDFNGDVYQFENADMNNYTNNTSVENFNLMFDLTLALAEYQRWTIFAIGGIGAAWTTVQYDDTAKADIPPSGIDLSSHTSSNFAFQFGGGLGFEIMPELDLTLTYLYTDLGDVSTGDSVNATEGNNPNISITPADFDLQQQSLLLGLEWNFI